MWAGTEDRKRFLALNFGDDLGDQSHPTAPKENFLRHPRQGSSGIGVAAELSEDRVNPLSTLPIAAV
jgi:hypothetical protein